MYENIIIMRCCIGNVVQLNCYYKYIFVHPIGDLAYLETVSSSNTWHTQWHFNLPIFFLNQVFPIAPLIVKRVRFQISESKRN